MRLYLICQLMIAVLLLPLSGGVHACENSGEGSESAALFGVEQGTTTQPDSCCDPAEACAGECCEQACAPGCGHCVAQGHGCSLHAFSALTRPMTVSAELVAFLAGMYSHLEPTPTPPPNIA